MKPGMSACCGQSAIPADGQGAGSASNPVCISTLSNEVVFPSEDVEAWSCALHQPVSLHALLPRHMYALFGMFLFDFQPVLLCSTGTRLKFGVGEPGLPCSAMEVWAGPREQRLAFSAFLPTVAFSSNYVGKHLRVL